MISIESILSLDSIHPMLPAGSRRDVFEHLIEEIGEKYPIDKTHTVELLVEREKLGSTGIGKGVAIPHALVSSLEEDVGCFARLSAPISFDSPDEVPVDLIFLLLAVDEPRAQHARLIAHISRTMENPRLQALLRKAKNKGEIHDIFKNWKSNTA